MVAFMLFEISATNGEVEGLGRHEMTILPRTGDFIEIESSYLEVIAVTLADCDDPTGAADVHARRVGDFSAHLRAIRHRAGS